jgi:glycosyltransferase involved in cell wall biosynthesis
MLRVGLDTSPLVLTKAGTARYLTSLLEGLDETPEVEVSKLSWGGDGRATKVGRDMLWYPSRLGRAAKGAGVDVLHCPTMRAPFRSKIPLVVSVHDVAVLKHPEMFNGWTRRYSERALPKVVRAANAIVVGSAFSRDELLELLPVDESKLRMIPYGVGPPFTPEGPAADGDYVLAVSTLEPRKNFDRLVEGFRRSGFDGLELRVVGAEGWGGVGVDGDRVRRLEGVDDEELARLYRGAVAVVYISLYEGFGLPVLEAMACGTPVVAPAGRPYDEFSHGIAFEVDPLDVDSIAAGIQRAVASGSQPVGVRRAADFTWERAVESHVDLYRELAG